MRHLGDAGDIDIPTPDVAEWVMPMWRCWHRLTLDRPWHGGGLGPMLPGRIPWRDVREWAEYHGMGGDDFAFLDACIRAMDDVFLEVSAAKTTKA